MNHKNIVILPADGKSNRRLLRPSRGEVARLDIVPTEGMTKLKGGLATGCRQSSLRAFK
jgi:hypothetical protein